MELWEKTEHKATLIYNNSFYYNYGSGDTYDSSYIQAYNKGMNNQWNFTYWKLLAWMGG